MNDSQDLQLAQLERELRSLSPMRADAALQRSLESAMHAHEQARPASPTRSATTLTRWVPWATAAAVTAIAAPAYFGSRQGASPTAVTPPERTSPAVNANLLASNSPAAAQPVAQFQRSLVPLRKIDTLQGAEDQGIIIDVDQGPVRRVRYNYLEQYQYQNTDDGSLLEIRVPHSKTRRTPVIY